jgi:hypothetical protein
MPRELSSFNTSGPWLGTTVPIYIWLLLPCGVLEYSWAYLQLMVAAVVTATVRDAITMRVDDRRMKHSFLVHLNATCYNYLTVGENTN